MKVCKACSQENWHRTRISTWNKNPKTIIVNVCIPCERKVTKKHQQENRDYWREANRRSFAKNGRKLGSTEVYHRRLQKRRRTDELTKLVTEEARDLARRRDQITGFKWHVDHILPLNGKTVSGLHVWNNLQVIPASLNYSKRNRVVEEMTKSPL